MKVKVAVMLSNLPGKSQKSRHKHDWKLSKFHTLFRSAN